MLLGWLKRETAVNMWVVWAFNGVRRLLVGLTRFSLRPSLWLALRLLGNCERSGHKCLNAYIRVVRRSVSPYRKSKIKAEFTFHEALNAIRDTSIISGVLLHDRVLR